ncbi:hypothetical protein RB195_007963 [Necator americanus]|uniref:CUB domain protein n=1 Tax=Necator americanus TaxID=51031 RepID=A0ABR1C2A6_NECAM
MEPRCHSYFLLFCCLAESFKSANNAVIFTNPGYPKPYKGALAKYLLYFTFHLFFKLFKQNGEAVAVLFYQFLANPGDCVTVCDANTECQSLCGDVMDHYKTKKILITNSTTTITMQSTASADGNYHSGIAAKSVTIDAVKRSFFECNSTVNLADGEPFFLVSQNYPNTPVELSRCEIVFTATDMIRTAIYDLVTLNSVTFKGLNESGNPVEINLSGRHVTDDEPVALYFSKSLRVSFTFSNRSTFYTRGFYILVDSFARGSPSSNACVNNGVLEVESGETIPFGIADFGSSTYPPNTACSYHFSNKLDGHQLAISMEFETEKCCDIMHIDGIAPPPYNLYNYQGFMQPAFQFANSNVVTMNFTSDGVVEGVGFNGTVYNIDCSCKSGVFRLDPQNTLLKIGSPGFLSGAPTYCPNLNCSWTVTFPNDYELILNVSALNLRTGSTVDQLMVADNFGKILLSSNSTILFGPRIFVLTSGEVSFKFTSSATSAFPPSLDQSGFLLDLMLVQKVFRKTTIQLTDNYFMADISTRLFGDGLNITYEYVISARSNKQVFIYFFTILNGIANIEIYDGGDTSGAMINTSFLFNGTISTDGTPLWLRSTGENLLVRVRPNLYNTKSMLDFQAMVTDWIRAPDCPPLVWTTSTQSHSVRIPLSGSNCLSILHATYDYDSSSGIVLDLQSSSQLGIYKGLTTNASHLLNRKPTLDYPKFIYGAYVVISYNSPQDNTVTYYWTKRGFATTITMTQNESGIIMSEDYLPQYPLNLLKQQFSIELISDSAHMTSIRIEFLEPTGQGHGTIQMQYYNKLLDEISYPTTDKRSIFEQCGTKVVVTYVSPGGMSNGLYARYSRGSQSCNASSLTRYSFFFILISILLILLDFS